MKTIIATDKAPKAIGPYSQAVKTGSLLFVSGQLGMEPSSGKLAEGGVEKEAVQALNNMKNILEAAGTNMSKVVKTTVLLESIDDFAAVNNIYAEYFPSDFPARACYQVAKLPAGGKVEIEAIAEV